MSKVRWGIVGAGRIAHTFAQDMAATSHGMLQSVAARSGDAARRFADQYGVPDSCGGYEALYADPKIDAVYVATPHTLHLQHAGDALRAGKAVLCEKPITINADECQTLIDIANDSSSYLMEAMWTWFLPAVRKAKEWVDAGRIGKIVQIKADFGYPLGYAADKREYDANLAGGCLLEMGVYPVALAALFAAQDPVEVSAVARHAPNGVEDDLTAILDYGDCLGTIGTSFRAKLQNWAYLIGEDGYIAIPDFWRASECLFYELDECKEHFRDDRESIGLNFEIQAVIDDLRNGRNASSVVSLADSLAFQQLMESIRSRFTP